MDTDSKESHIGEVEAKTEFSVALSKALSESKDFREIVKKEALKQITNDYDVLYTLIKDDVLSNGESVEDLFSRYIDVNRLRLIEAEFPTLTIFVPSLPENSFSAEIWDVNDEIPAVSYVTSNATDGINVIFPNGDTSSIDDNLIPTFPIVVVKENERVVKLGIPKSIARGNRIAIKSRNSSGAPLQFLDAAFDNINNSLRNESLLIKSSTASNEVPENLKQVFDAYDIFNVTGWQRDYVYYNLTPSTTKGIFNARFMEHMVGFEMVGDGMAAYKKISDQGGDPTARDRLVPPGRGRGLISWTDGEFEFKVKAYLGVKHPIGTELITYFRVKPGDLFDIDYKAGSGGYMYIKTITPKRVGLSLPLFEWNLENYSSTIKIAIEEVDAIQTTIVTSSSTSEFAGNFGYDKNWGDVVKEGLKFGSSRKETHTSSFQISTTLGNDELGEVMINFADPIIINKDNTAPFEYDRYREKVRTGFQPNYNTKYATGWYRIYISPKKIY